MKSFGKLTSVVTSIAICLTILVPSASASDAVAPIAAPAGIPSDVWNAFYKTSFVVEGVNANTRRWSQAPRISLLGNPNNSDISTARKLVERIGKICPNFAPTLDVSNSVFNANIYYVPQSEFTKVIPSANPASNSSLYYLYYIGSGLSQVTVVINSGITSQSDRDFWTTARIIQNLGLLNFTDNKEFPLLSLSDTESDAISTKDKELFALFCSSALFPGDSFQASAKTVQTLLEKRPSQAPLLTPQISLSPTSNSTFVKVSLLSVNELLGSGLIALNYKIYDRNGSELDSGSLSNAQNRLQNEWNFEASNLPSNEKLKISIQFSNSAGSGKVFSESFSTTQEVDDAQQLEVQEISIYDLPTKVSLTDAEFSLSADSSSGLDLVVTSQTPSVCSVTGMDFRLLKPGKCSFSVAQDGDEEFYPAETVVGSFQIIGKLQTINCVKGKLSKKFVGAAPKCPAGFKKK